MQDQRLLVLDLKLCKEVFYFITIASLSVQRLKKSRPSASVRCKIRRKHWIIKAQKLSFFHTHIKYLFSYWRGELCYNNNVL